MAEGTQSPGARLKDGLKFWLIVAVFCGIVGASAYHFGRNYVGAHLHEMEVKQRAPEILPQVSTAAITDDASGPPPVKPIVIMTEREPTAREERRARRETREAQDGAQLHAQEAAEDEAEDEAEAAGDEDESAGDEDQAAASGGPEYVVVAGSFADESNAQRQVERLAEQGYQPYLTSVEKSDVTYRRVNVAVFDSREQAEEVRDRLRSQGFDAVVWTEQE